MATSGTTDPNDPIESSSPLATARARQAADMAAYSPPKRGSVKPTNFRSRVVPPKPKRERARPTVPTPERLAKGDVVRSTGGAYLAESELDRLRHTFRNPDQTKAQAILDRLHDRASLARDPGMNDRMYEAGRLYEELVHRSGLGGISAQNLLGVRGSGDPAHMMPLTEAAAQIRRRVRKAWDILPDEAATAMHGMLIEGRDAESVGREASMYESAKDCRIAGMTLLRIALAMLVAARWA